ncbi:MAG TPA: hypothetical protein VKZ18_11400 [Polyangia bacterium]|nr:hypothetical protein [Polyangia bacterium]
MSGNKRRSVLAVGAAALMLTMAAACHRQPPPAPAPKPATAAAPKEFVHPFIPSPQVVKPPEAPCRARDLRDLIGAIRQSQRKMLPAVKKAKADGAPAACRVEAENRRLSAMVDLFTRDASGCVAKDSELDSQWNQLQSAVVALDGCVDCTRPAAARATSCQRAGELLDVAEKATPRP